MSAAQILWDREGAPDGAITLPMEDACVTYHSTFLEAGESRDLFLRLKEETPWRQERIRIYGAERDIPRLTAWYGDEGMSYTYSGIALHPLPWAEPLLSLKRRVEHALQTGFNSALLNLYRGGADGVGWHSDDEPELGPEPDIASVSLGAVRRFLMRHKTRKEVERVKIDLADGSLLRMRGVTQQHWQHQLPKTARPVGARINITFRTIQSHTAGRHV